MNKKQIVEMWEVSEGGEMPEQFWKLAESYFRRKSALYPQPFTESDYATCVMLYRFANRKPKKDE